MPRPLVLAGDSPCLLLVAFELPTLVSLRQTRLRLGLDAVFPSFFLRSWAHVAHILGPRQPQISWYCIAEVSCARAEAMHEVNKSPENQVSQP
ncbi:hypothetical protein B0H17DRAFT_1077610 [Mycena rosella]|uniref:Uncharacterized protein n=1 Tax=Mycena rosella TaxID=1033263 RepID=A0AAD7D553_MYCRO|nr:hypothetical protein B0H17DRAFT_1077610 [Mycena rosella]